MVTYDIALVGADRTAVTIVTNTQPPVAVPCTGKVKLAQRWLLEFLTELGSMPLRPTRGSTFMTRLAGGALDTELDVYAAFAAAVLTVSANLRSDETADDPTSEQLKSSSLVSVAVSADGHLTLVVRLASNAGETVNLSVNVPI